MADIPANISKKAATAADWWAEQLEKELQHKNNTPKFSLILARILCGGTPHITGDQIKNFRNFLKESISEKLQTQDSLLVLDCFIHPCDVIVTAAEKAEIDIMSFLKKKTMSITKSSITVIAGFEEKTVTLYEETI